MSYCKRPKPLKKLISSEYFISRGWTPIDEDNWHGRTLKKDDVELYVFYYGALKYYHANGQIVFGTFTEEEQEFKNVVYG